MSMNSDTLQWLSAEVKATSVRMKFPPLVFSSWSIFNVLLIELEQENQNVEDKLSGGICSLCLYTKCSIKSPCIDIEQDASCDEDVNPNPSFSKVLQRTQPTSCALVWRWSQSNGWTAALSQWVLYMWFKTSAVFNRDFIQEANWSHYWQESGVVSSFMLHHGLWPD